MTVADQIKILIASLEAWAKATGSTVKLANDLPSMFNQLGENPGAGRAVILWAGETPRTELHSDVESRMDQKYWIAISRGRGLNADRSKSLTEGVGGGLPMFQLIQMARKAVRNAELGPDDELLPFYKGTELMAFEGVTTDCYRIEITAATDEEDAE